MTALQTCPKCGGKMKFGRVKQHGAFTEKRRDCACGHGDKVHVRITEEILAIIVVAKRAKQVVRTRTQKPTQTKKARQNKSK